HSHARLYFGSQRLYRSDDRGDSWRAVSPDLTRALDRNKLPLMGKIWPVDSIQKNVSTALYDNISSISESPRQEGLIYVGTDDGLVQITEDGGKTWRKVEKPAGVPEDAYVQRILASQHDAGTVYVAYENHQNGDFKPYLIKSADKGRTWTNLSASLPERGGVYAIAEDYKDPKLLFAGTEFALFFSKDGGQKWIRLSVGLPTIMVRDLAIQKKMDDLIVATFGRGIYVIDDYSPLREAAAETLQKESALFSIRPALSYIPGSIFGAGKGDQGDAFFTAPNPPFGAAITYHLKEGYRSRAQERHRKERAAIARGEAPPYPAIEELRAEANEEPPAIVVTISDAAGKPVRRLDESASAGLHRVYWDLRGPANTLPAAAPTGGRGGRGGGGGGAAGGDEEESMFGGRGSRGALVLPGRYTATIAKRIDGVVTPLPGSQTLEVVGEGPASSADRTALSEFQDKLARLQKAFTATEQSAAEARARILAIRRAVDATPALPLKTREQDLALERQLDAITRLLRGDPVLRAHNEGAPAQIAGHLQAAASPLGGTTGHPTKTAMEQYQMASDELAAQIPKLRKLIEVDLPALEKQLDAAGAPYTPGRLPQWK
ncbi:MAG: glycosyl hydrolase, partial [Bryobacteraceae bacterium]